MNFAKLPFKFLLALLYRLAYKIHHWVFLKPQAPLKHARLIVVGSFRTGGAGKTPFCIWLCKHLKSLNSSLRIAVLCHKKAQDEFLLLKKHLPFASIFKTSNRYTCSFEIDNAFDYIICDDGFEDTRLTPTNIIRLDFENPPTHIKDLIPLGKFRSLKKDHLEETIVLKCGSDVSFEIEKISNYFGEEIQSSNLNQKSEIQGFVICGIGDPERFYKDAKRFLQGKWQLIARPDHDLKFEQFLLQKLKNNFRIIITEKDSMRLSFEVLKNPLVYIANQKVTVSSKISIPCIVTLDTPTL